MFRGAECKQDFRGWAEYLQWFDLHLNKPPPSESVLYIVLNKNQEVGMRAARRRTYLRPGSHPRAVIFLSFESTDRHLNAETVGPLVVCPLCDPHRQLGDPFIPECFVIWVGFRCVITLNLLCGKVHKHTPTYLRLQLRFTARRGTSVVLCSKTLTWVSKKPRIFSLISQYCKQKKKSDIRI